MAYLAIAVVGLVLLLLSFGLTAWTETGRNLSWALGLGIAAVPVVLALFLNMGPLTGDAAGRGMEAAGRELILWALLAVPVGIVAGMLSATAYRLCTLSRWGYGMVSLSILIGMIVVIHVVRSIALESSYATLP